MARDDGYTRYTVRIPTPLYERVKIASGEKSINAEIVATLEDAYPDPHAEFDLGTFITTWSARLNATNNPAKISAMTREANTELDRVKSEWRLEVSNENGNVAVRFQTSPGTTTPGKDT